MQNAHNIHEWDTGQCEFHPVPVGSARKLCVAFFGVDPNSAFIESLKNKMENTIKTEC